MAERKGKLFENIDMPRIPDGMIAVRFHGKLAFIPKKEQGEPMFGRSNFTVRQVQALSLLDRQLFALGQERQRLELADRNGYFTGFALD